MPHKMSQKGGTGYLPSPASSLEDQSAGLKGNFFTPVKNFLNTWGQRASLYLQLAKIRITLLATLSTSTGYILYSREWNREVLIPSLGIFLLASASASLNHLQDRNLDALMVRTQRRPLPSGKLFPRQVLVFSGSLFLLGSLILILGKCIPALSLGLFAALLYNVLYTHLKRTTPYAAIPGALIGAIPPLAGWVCAGGNPYSIKILATSAFLFLWQIPHFWLLALSFQKDFHSQPYPTILKRFNRTELSRLTFWAILATAFSTLLFPLSGALTFPVFTFLAFFSAFSLVIDSFPLLRPDIPENLFRARFVHINIFALFVLSLLLFNSLL
ncbi:MAG: UbiA family prenyltransferase [bacterium JZ-2024 1]